MFSEDLECYLKLVLNANFEGTYRVLQVGCHLQNANVKLQSQQCSN